ncbi:MAG: hypothetical protein KBT20_06490 [Bacteroidales bacterium]|nr:hypothetical protein [Candidatus Liminaster caballi]
MGREVGFFAAFRALFGAKGHAGMAKKGGLTAFFGSQSKKTVPMFAYYK